MQKKRLYFFVIVCSIIGMVWVIWNRVYYTPAQPNTGVNVCLFKAATGLPCPSCGSTRAIMDITRLDFVAALHENPIGFILVLALLLFPLWVTYDLTMSKWSFYHFYINMESVIRKRWVTISLILLVLANWAWNIYKFM